MFATTWAITLGARNTERIPGAHFLAVGSGICAQDRAQRPPSLPTPGLRRRFRHWASTRKQVVAYDQAQTTYSARLWWMLRWLGHRNAAVLDGGLDAWVRAGFGVTTAVPARKPARFVPSLSETPVSVETLIGHLADIDYTVMDGRGAGRFRGINETIDPVGGHIPGSHNRPYTQNLNADNTFKSADALRAEWLAALGGRTPAQIVHSCGSGVTACNNLLAMEVAGLSGSRLYPGSWSEWSADPARPLER
jgi:thiosulfate/3-mercaptopyruvate sulfurtransferase